MKTWLINVTKNQSLNKITVIIKIVFVCECKIVLPGAETVYA